MPDPRINCAAEICCDPPAALRAAAEILCDIGVAEDDAPKMAAKLKEMGITFTSVELAGAIAEIADHPHKNTAS
jgi:hypothetical protein